MRLTGGYQVYLPTPTMVVVQGQPYGSIQSTTAHIHPGWHLFGVPFMNGASWKDFKLYVSGNHVGIETAVEMGWVDAGVSTKQGSQILYHTYGDPFQPGAAYWIKTNVPVDMRLEAAGPDATAAAPAGGFGNTAPASLAGARAAKSAFNAAPVRPATSTAGSTASQTMGWLSAVFSTLTDVAKGVAAFAEGNIAAGIGEVAAGTFGLLEHGFEAGSGDSADSLSQIDQKLDTLIGSVGALSSQITNVDNQITALAGFESSNARLGQPMRDAETWLNDYYTDHTKETTSREWARWALAGCDTSGLTCPSGPSSVTAASVKNFKAKYMTLKDPKQEPAFSTDNFPLFWAYSVIGHQKGDMAAYNVAGQTADNLVTKLYEGLTDDMGQPSNGLLSYAQAVFASSPCANDVSDPGCHLYDDVYLNVENYFGKAVGYQSQLVAAVAESWNTLGQHNSAWLTAGKTYMSGVNQKLNREAEAFLQVAEQIALYRAADGTQDWGSFPNSDAAKLLARADFVVSRLAGSHYMTPGTAGNYNPPWPASGIVGRVFYANGESLSAGTRNVCTNASVGSFNCTNAIFTIGETVPTNPDKNGVMTPILGTPSTPGAVSGNWPYIEWSVSGGTAVGKAATGWTIQRLKPLSPQTNNYPASLAGQSTSVLSVNSTAAERLGAALVVATYDQKFNNPPQQGASSTFLFGSLSSVEGALGRYGLKLGSSNWSTTGSISNAVIQYSLSYNDSTNAPGAAYFVANYPTVDYSKIGTASTSWSSTLNWKLDTSALATPFTKVHVHWPTNLNVNLNSAVPHKMSGLGGDGFGRDEYYSYVKLDQQLLDNKGKVFAGASAGNSQCNSQPFNTCVITGAQLIDGKSMAFTGGTQYSFKASFSTEVNTYSASILSNATFRAAKTPSAVKWVLDAPMLTLTKQ